ncbi:MAG TPA: beta-N-acetylhexosaminidase, partial [Candidatus Lokiarchaeia archaeon]|nr:beta-N-acetylhexosaminidase [Candidatus Lokiarchaeia archaeon]
MNQALGIIPAPVKMSVEPGEFYIDATTTIFADELNQKNGGFLHDFLAISTGFDLPIEEFTGEASTNSILIQIVTSPEEIGDEGYLLKITPEAVQISARSPQGIFYGIQTMRLLLPPSIESSQPIPNAEWTLPCADILDFPRFPYRGYMLDVGRNFFGIDLIKPILDVMALLKMNVFHWHFTDDQGWRIEIKKYPKLVEIGSKRKDTQVGGLWKKNTTGRPHEGRYTQEEVKELVAYAAERYIKVIPEIEMPGHSLAALAAYPELSCTGGAFEVPTRFGVKKDVYCVGKDAVFDFLQGVLEEILEIFPSDIIHIGGDEVPKMRWKMCPDCQARIKAEGLQDEFDLQAYFMNRMASFLASRGR